MDTTITKETPAETRVAPQDLPADFDVMKWAGEQDRATDGQQADAQTAQDEATKAAEAAKASEAAKVAEAAKAGEQAKRDAAKSGEDSPETKAQKEAERRDRSWKALDQEKQVFRQEKAGLLQKLEALQREVQELRTRAEPPRDEQGVTAATYERLAREYAENGDDEMAQAARARADKLRRQQPAAPASDPTKATEPWKAPQFQEEWRRHTQEIITAEPALNDPENPVCKAVNTLLSDPTWAPYFLSQPTGIRAAVEVARLLEKSQKVDDLHKQIETLTADNQRLQKLTSPRGSHPNAPPVNGRRIEDMKDDEAQAEIRRIAEAADRGEL